MATIYLRSTDGNDADSGATWALSKGTLAAALTAAGAGGTVYVSQAHAETQAGAMTLSSPGTDANPVRVICVNDGAEPPTALATTATVTVSGNATMNFSGTAHSRGVTYFGAAGGSAFTYGGAGVPASWNINGGYTTTSSGVIIIGASSAIGVGVLWRDVLLKFGSTSGRIRARGRFTWSGTGGIDPAGSLPTYLLEATGTGDAGIVLVEGVNLSALGSGNALVGITAAGNSGDFLFLNCKLGSSVTILNGTIGAHGGPRVRLINCDSADTQYRFAQALYEGMETSETTVVRSGGATDGTTPMARKIVTTAGASLHFPYESLPIEFWNETLGSITVTIPVLTDNVTLTDAEAWLEVEYLGTSGFPLGVFVSDRVSDPIFGTPANQTTDSTSTWASAPGTPVKQSLSVTFTPQEKGIVRARVCIAKASTTVYYDPKVLTGSSRQYQSTAGFVNEPAGRVSPHSHFGYTGIAEH